MGNKEPWDYEESLSIDKRIGWTCANISPLCIKTYWTAASFNATACQEMNSLHDKDGNRIINYQKSAETIEAQTG